MASHACSTSWSPRRPPNRSGRWSERPTRSGRPRPTMPGVACSSRCSTSPTSASPKNGAPGCWTGSVTDPTWSAWRRCSATCCPWTSPRMRSSASYKGRSAATTSAACSSVHSGRPPRRSRCWSWLRTPTGATRPPGRSPGSSPSSSPGRCWCWPCARWRNPSPTNTSGFARRPMLSSYVSIRCQRTRSPRSLGSGWGSPRCPSRWSISLRVSVMVHTP